MPTTSTTTTTTWRLNKEDIKAWNAAEALYREATETPEEEKITDAELLRWVFSRLEHA